ncbi:MAG: hypothetical protein EPO24_08105, partial [Bacteroidetes bacterium]
MPAQKSRPRFQDRLLKLTVTYFIIESSVQIVNESIVNATITWHYFIRTIFFTLKKLALFFVSSSLIRSATMR